MNLTRSAAAVGLSRILDSPAGVEQQAAREQSWFESLLRWLLERDRLAAIGVPNRSARLHLLTTMVDAHPRRDALLNFGVSFALALRVALQARGLVAVDRRRLLRGIVRALLQTPGRFFFPPYAQTAEPHGTP